MLLTEKNLFNKEECNEIINYKIYNQKNWKSPNRSYTSYDLLYDDNTKWIYDRLENFFSTETNIEFDHVKKNIHYHKFVIGDKFDLHDDDMRQRLYGVGVILNDNYKGGDFIFYKPKKTFINKDIGNSFIYDVRIKQHIKQINFGEFHYLLWFIERENLKIEKNHLL